MKKPKEVATHYGVGHMKVLRWIRQGIMPALDVSEEGSPRKRYLISDAHMAEFERNRMTQPQPKQPAKRKRRDIPELV